jgi:hypothetical protein
MCKTIIIGADIFTQVYYYYVMQGLAEDSTSSPIGGGPHAGHGAALIAAGGVKKSLNLYALTLSKKNKLFLKNKLVTQATRWEL